MAKLSSEETVTAVLSYLGILVLIPFFIYKKRSEFMKFHLRQGITLSVIALFFVILSNLVNYFVGDLLSAIISLPISLIQLAIFVLMIIAIVNGVQGKQWEIPLVSKLTHLVTFV